MLRFKHKLVIKVNYYYGSVWKNEECDDDYPIHLIVCEDPQRIIAHGNSLDQLISSRTFHKQIFMCTRKINITAAIPYVTNVVTTSHFTGR